jgi:hypothetical protein
MSENNLKKPKTTKLALLLHLIAAIHFIFGVYYDMKFVHVPKEILSLKRHNSDFGGKFKYLTIINAVNNFFVKFSIIF